MPQRWRIAVFAGVLSALLLAAPTPASARVTVTVEVAYGGVIVGGIGLFIYIGGSWEVSLAGRSLPTALLEIREGRAQLGVPLPRLHLDSVTAGTAATDEQLRIDLLRWRF